MFRQPSRESILPSTESELPFTLQLDPVARTYSTVGALPSARAREASTAC